MLTPYLIIDTIIAAMLLIIGSVVLLKNGKILLNRLFFFFSVFIAAWILTNYFSNNFAISLGAARIANHLVLFFSGLAVLYLLKFVIVITKNDFLLKKASLISVITYVACFLTLTPLVVVSIARQENVYAIEFGPLSSLYFLTLGFNSIAAFVALLIGVRRTRGQDRLKIQTILWSLGVMISINLFTNAVVPLVTGSFSLTNLGPLTSVILVGGLSYSIVKHRLFDIRLIVARSLAYILLLTSLVALYGLVVFGITATVFGDSVFSQQVVPIFTALLLAFTSPYLRKLFDKTTNRLFYRDAYDPQAFLDELNKELVSNADLEALLSKTANIIAQNIKAEYCLFGLKETAYSQQRMIGNKEKRFDDEDIAAVRAITPSTHQTVIVADGLDDEDELRKKLRKYDIAILARLTSDADKEVEGLGYLVLGQKKSGNPYNKQDVNIIEIIANELVIAIQNALRFEEIEKFNITLQQKVDEATKKLKHTNEKLKALDETKDEFISMASHQLRTPLTSVKGYLSMVLEGDAGEISAMQRKLLDQAFVSSQRMVYLIADLLNVSRLRTGKFVIEPIASNLADVVEGEIGQLKETAAGRGLELTYDKPSDFPTLYLDETKIRQVIMNFTDNAIYYTPSGGHITVKLEDKGESIECTITDDGMGVPKNEQPHLFTKFYRADNAKKARPDGTGLGLFMAKKVIVAQGGSIIFDSKEGKGSTFGFMFPKDKLQLPAGGVAAEPAQETA